MNNLRIRIKYLFILILCSASVLLNAQTDPSDSIPGDPGGLSVHSVQNLQFGAFSHGSSGGSVIISTAGSRSVTGDVVPLDFGISYMEAIFEVVAPNGAIISLMNGPDAVLTGSNGGTMTLELGESSPESPYINTIASPDHTSVHIAGTLTVGNAMENPPGTYSGSFYIIFNLE